MNRETIEDHIRKYVSSAQGYARALKIGDAEKSDKYFDEVENAFKELKGQGRSGLEAISRLLGSDDDGVKLWAAAHLLNYPEFNSLAVLEALRRSSSILALTAEVTLDKWRNGEITY